MTSRATHEKGRLPEAIIEVPNGFKTADWIRDLRLRYTVLEEQPVNDTTHFYDTFDGRLFDQELACSASRGSVRLHAVGESEGQTKVAIEPLPRFAAEFPEGRVRDRLSDVAKHRALLKVFTLSTNRRSWRVLNSDQKTLARILLEDVDVCDQTQAVHIGPFLIFKPIRGYESIAEELAEWLEEKGLHRLAGSVYLAALDALHKTPNAGASIPRVEMPDAMPAAEAVRHLLRSLYEVVRLNEAGLLADTDAEFLHDYRVGIRKARSLVGQSRGVFALEPTARLGKSLSWLGRATNTLRDIDVFLLHRSGYAGLLPSPLDEGLEAFFAFLQEERKEAFRAFQGIAGSREYVDALSGWGECMEDPVLLGVGPRGRGPIGKFAARRIAKKCRRVLESGYELTGETAPAAMHALRIECKHLRYLMEFFAEFVPGASSLIRRTKKLQDSLGKIQDLTVHEEKLRHYAQRLESTNKGANTARATHELIARLNSERDREQARVIRLFGRFNASLGETDPPYAILLPWLKSGRFDADLRTSLPQ